ncbi:MAG: DUF3857 domain-containing transglutaminase family protein [Gemmatimonadaceae bacterium]
MLLPLLRRSGSAVAGLLIAIAPTVGAQDALWRPAASDTIYRLAVDSAAYKDYSFVYLLDDGIVTYETDGRGMQRYHQIVQILKPRGVRTWAERAFSFRPGHSKVTVNSMRVVRPSGELISDKPSISQASDVPAAMSNPVYSDTKVLRYSLSGVAVGTIVDIDWTDETLDAFLPGDFTSGWRTTMDYPAMRSRYVLDLPSSMTPRIIEHYVDVKRSEQEAKGRHYYAWAKQTVMPVKGELFAPDSSIPRMAIDVSSPEKWSDIAMWYGNLANGRYGLSPRATAIVDSVVRPKRTAADTVRALQDWIAKDIRYVSVALGLGGYQPRFPDSTITSGFGDCKDKATLFIAAARHLGLTAYPVLLNSTGVADTTMPSITAFDHAIAALQTPGSKTYTFLDLTTNAFPPGKVPPGYQGEFGLVVLPGGKSEDVTFPKDAPAQSITSFAGTVSAEGKISGRLDITAHGIAESIARTMFLEPLDSARRVAMGRAFGQVFPNAIVDSLITFDGRDPNAEPRISVIMHGGDGAKKTGPVAILTLPGIVHAAGINASSILARMRDEPERKYPVDAGSVVGPSTTASDFRVTLPEGRKAQLPKGVVATGPFGDYRSEYSQDGRVLHVSLRLAGTTGVLPKERYAELKTWLKTIADDNVDAIVLSLPPTP